MAKILGIGIATLDIINFVDTFPEEDTEIRATGQKITRGGNVTNTLCILSQLKHRVYWSGTLANENDANIIQHELEKYNINTDYVKTYANGKAPTSYILLNKLNGSRSIVHYRDLPELDYTHFQNIALDDFDWIHFEARNIEQTLKMLQYLKQHHPNIPCSVEFEKQRESIQQLYKFADVLIFSKNYCLKSEQNDAEKFLSTLSKQFSDKTFILAWGDQGCYGCRSGSDILHSAAHKPTTITDTLAAGDTFNAGIIDSLINACNLEKTLDNANHLAACKIAVNGLDISDYV